VAALLVNYHAYHAVCMINLRITIITENLEEQISVSSNEIEVKELCLPYTSTAEVEDTQWIKKKENAFGIKFSYIYLISVGINISIDREDMPSYPQNKVAIKIIIINYI